MISLFENYTEREKDLEHSLKEAGQARLTVVLNDDGFLPTHVASPIGFFTRMDMVKKTSREKPRFFNNLTLPPFWEIRSTGSSADIFEGYKKKGEINFSQRPGDYRLIQSVDWLNEAGRIRSTDLYNQNGLVFGKKTFSDGEHVLTTYFDVSGKEVLLMNHVLNTIQLHYNQKKYVFSDYNSFILFYFKVAQLPVEKILYNSLGRPYFIINALHKSYPDKDYSHLLFWQEFSQRMPGNMKGIFESQSPTTRQIIVQDRKEYERLRQQAPISSPVELSYLGYLFDFKRESLVEPSILIHTNSDQLEKIQDLIQKLPEFKFHISARTEMSQKLMRLEECANVTLYPNISTSELQTLIAQNCFYLDINQGSEIDHVIRQAFEYNLLLFAFTETLHSPRLISPDHVFDKADFGLLAEELQRLVSALSNYLTALRVQWQDAGQTTIEAYKEVMQ